MNDLIDGAVLTRFTDGDSLVELTADDEPVHTLAMPDGRARALLRWLRRRGRVRMPQVWAELRRLERETAGWDKLNSLRSREMNGGGPGCN